LFSIVSIASLKFNRRGDGGKIDPGSAKFNSSFFLSPGFEENQKGEEPGEVKIYGPFCSITDTHKYFS